MPTIKVDYTCPKCGFRGQTETDDDAPERWVEVLSKLIWCNRCADYRNKTDRIGERISRCAYALIQNRSLSTPNQTVTATVQEKLTNYTKDFAHVVCRYHGHKQAWTEDFVLQIMDRPERAGKILSLYQRTIRSGEFNV